MIIAADVNLPALDTAFSNFFEIVTYEEPGDLKEILSTAEILLCRSTLDVNKQLINGTAVKLVVTATSGTNHIDKSYLAEQGIALITAKGANASAVVDWDLFVLSHIQTKLSAKKIGIIGMGHVGSQLKHRLSLLNYEVATCDPLLEKKLNFIHTPLEQLVSCDILFIHANLHSNPLHPSKNLINYHFLNSLKPDCFIVNASRGGIVNESALLETDFIRRYCTDVYENEPEISVKIVENAYICTPHIAGHTIEAKTNAIFQVSEIIHNLFHVSPPPLEFKSSHQHLYLSNLTWPKTILKYYDPMHETVALKNSNNKHLAFLELRKSHTRHGLLIK